MVAMLTSAWVRRAAALVALTGAALAVSLPAAAHAELVSSNPADGATVTELTSVHLEFSEDLLDIGNSITVTDGAGVGHELEVAHPSPAVLEAAVADLAPGTITIAWRNASVDGHTEEGELHVTLLAPSPSPSASPSPTPTATVTATAVATVTPSVAPTPSATPTASAGSGSGVSTWVWGLLGLAVVGIAAAALIAATRRPPTE